jgi:hypothetical protein
MMVVSELFTMSVYTEAESLELKMVVQINFSALSMATHGIKTVA